MVAHHAVMEAPAVPPAAPVPVVANDADLADAAGIAAADVLVADDNNAMMPGPALAGSPNLDADALPMIGMHRLATLCV